MDSCDYDDGVEEKKASLLGRYDLFQLFEFFIAVALISWSLFRIASVLKLSGDNLWMISSSLLNHHVVFLVGNVIIVVCYVLSRRFEDGNRSEKYDVKCSSFSQRKTTEAGLLRQTSESEETSGIDAAGRDVRKTSVTPETEETSGEENPNDYAVETESETEMEVAIKQAVRQIERFRRTQSEKLKREMSIKPHRELRRLVTAGRSSVDERSIEMVEELSNEEFQMAVESFISKQQSFLKEEGMAENGSKF